MHSLRKGILSLLLLLALGAGSALALNAAPAPDYFPLGEGFWWKYRLDDSFLAPQKEKELSPEARRRLESLRNIMLMYKVTGRKTLEDGSKGWVVQQTMPGQPQVIPVDHIYSKSKGWALCHTSIWPLVPVQRYLPSPPVKGATWSWKGTGSPGKSVYSLSCTVAGTETVEVPVGRFEAVKVVRVESSGSGNGKTLTTWAWYADQVGLVKQEVRLQGKAVEPQVLLDYSVGQKKR